MFTVGVVLTAVTIVFDQATIAVMRGGKQLFRNAVFATVKLPALWGIAAVLHDDLGVGIAATWVVGLGASLLAVGALLRATGTAVLWRPDWQVLRGLGKTALAHSWLNIALALPFAIIPVLVTIVVSPAANAAFYAAWTLTSVLKIIPTHLSTVLFAIAAATPKAIARKIRFTLRLSILLGVPAMVALALTAHFILSLFGPGYASAGTVPMWLLIVGYLPGIPKAHYVAVCRAQNRIVRAAAVMSGAAIAEIAATVIGGRVDGLVGLSLALLVVQVGEALVMAPAVVRAAIGRGRHRQKKVDIDPQRHVTADIGRVVSKPRLTPGSSCPTGTPSPLPDDRLADLWLRPKEQSDGGSCRRQD